MGHTNETANVELSQFLGTDKPAWLVDYNGDMAKIDAYAYTNRTKAVANENAITALSNRVTTVENTITNTITPALTSAQNNITTLQGNITTINSLIGNGTPTTTDQTIIGAINEINANLTKVESFGTAVDISSDIAQPDGFTPDVDGFITFYMNPSSASDAYASYTSSDASEMPLGGVFVFQKTSDGSVNIFSRPVKSGNTYKRGTVVNAGVASIFTPLNNL